MQCGSRLDDTSSKVYDLDVFSGEKCMPPAYPRISVLTRRAIACAVLTTAFTSYGSVASPVQEEPAASPWQDRLETLRYWTPKRMREAAVLSSSSTGKPIEPPVTPGGDEIGYAPVPLPYARSMPTRVTGQLFFHDPLRKEDGHCSASVVQSASRRLILTAAHCVVSVTIEPPLMWNEHLMFVPAYDGTRPPSDSAYAPYGAWPITRVYVSAVGKQNPVTLLRTDYDVAVAGVFDDAGPIEDVVCGGLMPRLSNPDDPSTFPKVRVVGYPSAKAYSGAEQFHCESSTMLSITPSGIRLPQCGLASGNSGGPVMVVDDNDDNLVQVAAVVHNTFEQSRLLPYVYPVLEAMANSEHRRGLPAAPTSPCP